MLQAPRNPLDTASLLSDATEDVIRALLVKGESVRGRSATTPWATCGEQFGPGFDIGITWHAYTAARAAPRWRAIRGI